jgi:LmbE family N-acetylglucosaminyl deacetylase
MGHPNPDHFVDVTDHMDTSANALAQHVSQIGDRPAEEIAKMMKRGRRDRAIGKGMQHAEGFRRVVYGR